MPYSTTIHQLHIEPARNTEFKNSRRRKSKHHCFAYLCKSAIGAADNGLYRLLRARPLRPVLKVHKGNARVLPVSGKTEPCDSKNSGNIFLLVFQKILLKFFENINRTFLRGSSRSLDHCKHNSLIFIGKK